MEQFKSFFLYFSSTLIVADGGLSLVMTYHLRNHYDIAPASRRSLAKVQRRSWEENKLTLVLSTRIRNWSFVVSTFPCFCYYGHNQHRNQNSYFGPIRRNQSTVL